MNHQDQKQPVETSREAVERLVARMKDYAQASWSDTCWQAASTLTALLERCEKAEADATNYHARMVEVEADDSSVFHMRTKSLDATRGARSWKQNAKAYRKLARLLEELLSESQARVAEAEKDAANIRRLHALNETFVGIEARESKLREALGGLQTYGVSNFPGENALVPTHPSNGGELYYRKCDIDAALAGSAQQVPSRAQSKPDRVTWVRNYRNENGCRLVDAIRQYDLLYGDSKSAQPSAPEDEIDPGDRFGAFRND